jgi:hypothetical protein
MINLAHHQSLGPQLALRGWCDQRRDFFFLRSPFSQKISAKKLWRPRNLPPEGERPMILTRLPTLGAITLTVVMILNCVVAVAGPNQTSADYVMPGCRDVASLITFSNAAESKEQVSLMSFCAGIVVGLSFMGQPYGICVPAGTTSQQVASVVVQYIDGQPARIREDFNHFAVEALRANWPCSLVASVREPLPVALR